MNILIIGPSGTGKSTIGKLLKERGYNLIEADTDTYQGKSIAYFINKKTGEGVNMPWPRPKDWGQENDWVWRVDVLQKQLQALTDNVNFVCGEAHNKREAYHLFDRIFVLSTDDKTLRKRVLSRKDNYFGKKTDQLEWIVEQNKQIVNEAKYAKGTLIDATKPTDKVVDTIINLMRS